MSYRLTRNVKVLSNGLTLRQGQVTGPGVVPPALWQRWIDDGVVVEIAPQEDSQDESLEQLRERAKAAGIDYYWTKNADTLREELDDAQD